MKLWISLACLFLLPVVHGQVRKVTGTVRDEGGKVLSGATVTARGVAGRAVTDAGGRFSLEVGAAVKALAVSHVGMALEEVVLTEKVDYAIVMKPLASTLSDVVVVGYGTVRKGDLTGAVQRIDRDELLRNDPLNLQQSLQGKVAGVNITQNDGAPGAGLSIRIRGSNSFLGGT